MLRIVNVPNVLDHPIPQHNRSMANSFLRHKKWIVDNAIYKATKLYMPTEEIKDIKSHVMQYLWYMYCTFPNKNDNFYFHHCLNRVIYILKGFKNNITINTNLENLTEINQEPSIQNIEQQILEKIDIERMEKNLSPKTKAFLVFTFMEDLKKTRTINDSKNRNYSKRRNIRDLIKKKYGFINKDMKLIDNELKNAMSKYKEKIYYGGAEITNLIAEEIY